VFDVSGGVTTALALTGRVDDIAHPEKMLDLVHIRSHIEFGWKLRISKIIINMALDDFNIKTEQGMREWWTDEERQQHRAKFERPNEEESIFLGIRGVIETSRLSRRAKFGMMLEIDDFKLGLLDGEYEQRHHESKGDLFLGTSFGYKSFSTKVLKAVNNEELRVEARLEVASF